MKKIISISIFLSVSFVSLAQPLGFSTIGSEEAFCRTLSSQSGNGVIYAAGSGGTPPYTYEWKNLGDGQTTNNTTWGGLNPGDYQIIIWDAINDSVVQTLFLDSINPASSFNVISSGLTAQGNDLYWGDVGVQVQFESTATGVYNFNDPNADTSVFWQMTQFEDWYSTFIFATEEYTYNYGGTWAMSLVAVNSNGCSDTAKAHIWLNGAAGMDETNSSKVYYWQNKLHLIVDEIGDYSFNLYDLSGKLIVGATFNEAFHSDLISEQSGIYLISVEKGDQVILNERIVITE
jgi:hypothetical protein